MHLQSILLVIQVILAISLIALILLQHGRGAQAGAAFGSGASSTVFGARGAVPFLVKVTTVLAIVFFANSLGLAYLSAKQPEPQSLIDRMQQASETAAPAEPSLVPAEDVPSDDSAGAVNAGEPVADGAGSMEESVPDDVPADVPVDDVSADAGADVPADVPPPEE